jgi:ABC-type cobalamin transport system permease subunit
MKVMSLDNRYAFACGVAVYMWQHLLNIPTDLVVGVIKAALFGAAGMAGKELFSYIRKAVLVFFKTRKSKSKRK